MSVIQDTFVSSTSPRHQLGMREIPYDVIINKYFKVTYNIFA